MASQWKGGKAIKKRIHGCLNCSRTETYETNLKFAFYEAGVAFKLEADISGEI